MVEELSLESGLLQLTTGHMMTGRSLKHSSYLPPVILWQALDKADQAKAAEHPMLQMLGLSTPELDSPANNVLPSYSYRLVLLL